RRGASRRSGARDARRRPARELGVSRVRAAARVGPPEDGGGRRSDRAHRASAKRMIVTEAAVADRKARAFLRKADPVLGRIIDAHPDFRPRAWLDELPPLDAFGTLIFQVAGQQLSVRATQTIVSRIEEHFGGRLPYRSLAVSYLFASQYDGGI